MTTITQSEIAAGTFSRRVFLVRRLRRLFFPLLVVVIACCLWSGLWYLPGDYNRMVRDATSVLIARTNFVFSKDPGYFTPDSQQNIFLHTWSLSVEAQFYVAFAILATVVLPRVKGQWSAARLLIFVAVFLASLAWCIASTKAHPLSAFYLLPSRTWEFLSGAIVAFMPRYRQSNYADNVLTLVGLTCLAVAIFCFHAGDPYPGWRVLFPVTGTALIIYARAGSCEAVLSLRPFQLLGDLSYSLYLWHWPLLIAFRERTGANPAGFQTALLLAFAFALSGATYWLVEKNIRRFGASRRIVIGAAAAIAGLFAYSGAVSASNGWPERLPSYLQPAVLAMDDGNPRAAECSRLVDGRKLTPGDFCNIGKLSTEKPMMMLWGDSFADRLQPVVDEAARKVAISGVVATEGGCPPWKGKVFKGSGAEVFPGCEKYANFVFDYLLRTPSIRIVVIAGDWQRYDTQYEGEVLRQIAQILKKRSGRMVLISMFPSPRGDLPHQWAREQFQAGHAIPNVALPISTQSDLIEKGKAIVATAEQPGNVDVIDPFRVYCTATACATVQDDIGLFSDTDHLSESGLRLIGPLVETAISEASAEIHSPR